jgi:lactoylglutathione lyase
MSRTIRLQLCTILLGALATASAGSSIAAAAGFSSDTIDLGVVVSDLEKSVTFYTQAIGLTEVQGFSVSADFCTDAGLTDRQALSIRVLVTGEDAKATRLKLMELPGVPSKKNDNAFVHSQLGYRYLTLHVSDLDAALERLKKASVKPLAKGPVPLPPGFPVGIGLIVVRDPDGNLVELVGPKH